MNTPSAVQIWMRKHGLEVPAVEFHQDDPRWRDEAYGIDETLETAGCGPAAMAILLHHHGVDVTPEEVAEWNDTNRRRYNGHTTIQDVEEWWPGFRGVELDVDGAIDQLRDGNLIIFSGNSSGKDEAGARKQYRGHFMVINGVNDEGTEFSVLDPNGEGRQMATVTREVLDGKPLRTIVELNKVAWRGVVKKFIKSKALKQSEPGEGEVESVPPREQKMRQDVAKALTKLQRAESRMRLKRKKR
jgi:hypothetical protein